MSSAPGVPGVEAGASRLGGCKHVRTAGALELLTVLRATFGPRRAELPESRAICDAERAGGTLREFPAGMGDVRQGDWRVAPLAPGLVDFRVGITGPADRKLVNSALNCDAKIRPVPSRSWSSSRTARRSRPRRGRTWASRCRSGTAPGRPLLPAGPFRKESVHARRLPAGV